MSVTMGADNNCVYVDDLIIACVSNDVLIKVKQNLSSMYKLKDMGEFHCCLGVSVVQDYDSGSIWLHQKQYILGLLD